MIVFVRVGAGLEVGANLVGEELIGWPLRCRGTHVVDLQLAQLIRNVERCSGRPCEDCGASVSSELIATDGAGWDADWSFRRTDRR